MSGNAPATFSVVRLSARISWIISEPAALVKVADEVGAGGTIAPLPMSPSRCVCRAVAKVFIEVRTAAGTQPAR